MAKSLSLCVTIPDRIVDLPCPLVAFLFVPCRTPYDVPLPSSPVPPVYRPILGHPACSSVCVPACKWLLASCSGGGGELEELVDTGCPPVMLVLPRLQTTFLPTSLQESHRLSPPFALLPVGSLAAPILRRPRCRVRLSAIPSPCPPSVSKASRAVMTLCW